MTLRRLGISDIRVSPVGLGCWQFSQGHGLVGRYWPPLGDDSILDIVRAALEGGVNWCDTAEAYGRGSSERALVRALESLGKAPGEVLVATKWWPLMRNASSIGATIGERLRCLAPWGIDLYQVHQPYGFSSVEREMDAMAGLADRGLVRHIGVSNFSADRMRRADRRLRRHGYRLAANQVRYSMLDRAIEVNGVMDAARELDVSIIAYSPLAQGLLGGKFHRRPPAASHVRGIRRFLKRFSSSGLEKTRPLVEALASVGSLHDAVPAQVALAWLLQRDEERIVVIPGATSGAQARENASAANIVLTPDERARLDEASLRCLARI